MAPRTQFNLLVLVLLSLGTNSLAQSNDTQAEQLPGFNQPINVLGAMERTDQDFADGLALDLFSPKNRTLTVSQNKAPLPASFVTGTTGEPFIALQNFSYIIRTNDSANDLVGAKIEIPYDPVTIANMGVQEANTFVGRLAADGKSWVVDETTRNVHRSENNTRIIKMTSLDGEYMLLGRQTADTSNIFVQYGFGETRTVNVTGGGTTGARQEAEFIDGLRFSMVAEKNVRMNVDLRDGVPAQSLPAGMTSLNSFAWVVNTSDPTVKMTTAVRIPFNRNMLAAIRPGQGDAAKMLAIAKKPLNATATDQFQVANKTSQKLERSPVDAVTLSDVTQVDGQYILVVAAAAAGGQNGNGQDEDDD